MRGSTDPQLAMLTTLSAEDLIPPDHPIRRIRRVVDVVLGELDDTFEAMYAAGGRRSVSPETLLKSTVLMAMYSIRSERAFSCGRLNYDLLFKWFLDLRIDEPAFDASTFSKNRQRLLDHEVADEFFAAVVAPDKLRRYVSSDHFSVDGTLLEAWASHKSFKPTDQPPSPPPEGRNNEVQWHGQKRSNDTHASTTDPQARLARKSAGTAAKLCYAGRLLLELRNALIVDAELAAATGYAERDCAAEMLARLPKQDAAPSPVTRDTTPKTSLLAPGRWGSHRTSPRTPPTDPRRSIVARPATPATSSVNGSANGSRNPSVGSRRSPGDASCATSAKPATEPGSSSPPPSTTCSASPPSTSPTPDQAPSTPPRPHRRPASRQRIVAPRHGQHRQTRQPPRQPAQTAALQHPARKVQVTGHAAGLSSAARR
jgi:transposase